VRSSLPSGRRRVSFLTQRAHLPRSVTPNPPVVGANVSLVAIGGALDAVTGVRLRAPRCARPAARTP
jgi:hypothetical protein